MHISKLPIATQQLLSDIQAFPELKEFILVGGTALALRHGHRISEDLDFAIERDRLPRATIQQILNKLEKLGYLIVPIPHPREEDDFIDTGLELADYQQDYQCQKNGELETKLSFFTPEDSQLLMLGTPDKIGATAIASDKAIFAMKSVVMAKILRSKDVYDLWWLIENGHAHADEITDAYKLIRVPTNRDTAFKKLISGIFPITDQGYIPVPADSPGKSEICSKLWSKVEASLLKEGEETFSGNHLPEGEIGPPG